MTPAPLCPTCRYDLSATPDGRCPECGGAFTQAALHDSLLLRRSRSTARVGVLRAVSLVLVFPAALMLLAVAEAGTRFWPSDIELAAPALTGLWVLWLAESMRSIRGIRSVVLAIVVTALTALPFGAVAWRTALGVGIFAILPLLLVIAARVRSWPTRGGWVGLLVAGVVWAITGAVWTHDSLDGVARGVPLSGIAWWPEHFYTGRYTITTSRALAVALALLAAGSLSTTIAFLRLGPRPRRIAS